jgi:RNA 2',3'-cyclic 3'-phosphodiesterase
MRLFIALEVPPAVRAGLLGFQAAAVASREGLAPVAEESLHLTLAFLGEVEPGLVDPLSAVLDDLAGAGRPGLALGTPFWLPRRRPRVLTVAVDDDDRMLRDVQGQLTSLLRQRTGLEPEARIFFPHITVARVRDGAKVRPAPLTGPEPLEFVGETVTLLRSAGGYRALHSIRL